MEGALFSVRTCFCSFRSLMTGEAIATLSVHVGLELNLYLLIKPMIRVCDSRHPEDGDRDGP